MKSIYCVLKSGGAYAEQHVQWLKKQCDTHAPGVSFFCLTDLSTIHGVRTLPLQHDWSGWWAKIELFKYDDVFYLDLDTVILNDIRYMLSLSDFHAIRNFKNHKRWWKVVLGSAVMTWGKSPRFIYDDFTPALTRKYENKKKQNRWRDQGYNHDALKGRFDALQDIFPRRILSYKLDQLGNTPPEADIICFHGYPRPWEADEPWVPHLEHADNH